MNKLAPSIDARLEDCVRNKHGELSIMTSMFYFTGRHPEPTEADKFVKSLGFELLSDGSSTLDYINAKENLIIRDCHAGNWIKAGKVLIPIDIIPETFMD